MARLKIGGIIASVRGYSLNNGLPYFQKSVPQALRKRLGRATIKIPLKEENGHYAVQCHRLDQKYTALFRALREDPSLVPSETKQAAYALLAIEGLKPGDALVTVPKPDDLEGTWDPLGHVDAFVDALQDAHDGVPNALTNATLKALRAPLPVLLSEAMAVYLENHKRGTDEDFAGKQRAHWNKLIDLVGDIGIESLTREHARQYRDHRLRVGVTSTTVQREINVIRAVINVARREIPLKIGNPFESIVIHEVASDDSRRLPYTSDEVQALVTQSLLADDERRRIVIVLAVTGARLAEIVGLRRSDVDTSQSTIAIRPHKARGLKTVSSVRVVPLLPVAADAIKRQLASHKGELVFPSYANQSGTNANSASAALNKWAQGIVPGKTMHSFRHAMRDFMRAVMCPESVTKEIGGWSTNHDISIQYGQGYPVEVKRDWLAKAYSWLSRPEV